MKKWILFLLMLFPLGVCIGQTLDPVHLMLAYQEKYAGNERVSGQVRWSKQNGESTTGHFVIEGEKFHITWVDGELISNGVYEWEVMHRSKRIKKRFYDPLIVPAVLMAFRLVRLDLTAEPVQIGGAPEMVAINIEFGSSVAQGSHFINLDPKTYDPTGIVTHVTQEGFYEKAEIGEVKLGDRADVASYEVDFPDWKKRGYSLTDMAKGESDAIWPEERALKGN
jgi:hypothetical protein